MSDLTVDGMALAPGVVETIVSIAVGRCGRRRQRGQRPRGKPRHPRRARRQALHVRYRDRSGRKRQAADLGAHRRLLWTTCCPTWRPRFASLWRTPWQARWARRLDRSTSTSMASSSTVRNKKKHRGLFAHGIEKTRAHDGTSRRAAGSVHRRDQGRIAQLRSSAEGVFPSEEGPLSEYAQDAGARRRGRTASSSTAA